MAAIATGFAYCEAIRRAQPMATMTANPLVRMLYGRISVGCEYANGLQAMLKPALYKKRKRSAMYAAASVPFLSNIALVMVPEGRSLDDGPDEGEE
jgi:hypothetical protein